MLPFVISYHIIIVPLIHRCNRFKEQREADAEVKKARNGLMENYLKSAQEGTEARLKRFNHYHSRYSNHLNSLEVYT